MVTLTFKPLNETEVSKGVKTSICVEYAWPTKASSKLVISSGKMPGDVIEESGLHCEYENKAIQIAKKVSNSCFIFKVLIKDLIVFPYLPYQ